MNVNQNVIDVNRCLLSKSMEKFGAYEVKSSRDVLKEEDVKKKIAKIYENIKLKGYKNVTSNMDFKKFNTGTKQFDAFNKPNILFFDPDTNVAMFRNNSGKNFVHNFAVTLSSTTEKFGQRYYITAVFCDMRETRLLFKNVCEVKIKH